MPFTLYTILWIVLFAVCFITLRVKFDDGDYSTLSENTITFIQSYRNSVGDIATPGYDDWIEEKSDSDSTWETIKFNIIIFVIWGVWIG